MKNSIEIPIGDKKLVVFVNDWSDSAPKEIIVSLDDESGMHVQDICMVRECHYYNEKSGVWETNSKFVDCIVWGNSDTCDYTDKFCIGVYEEEDEE